MNSYNSYDRNSASMSQSDDMLHINGDLRSGFNSPKGSNYNNLGYKQSSRVNPKPATVQNPTTTKYRNTMVFSIQMNEDEQVADQSRKKPFTIPVVRVELTSDGSNKLSTSRISTNG